MIRNDENLFILCLYLNINIVEIFYFIFNFYFIKTQLIASNHLNEYTSLRCFSIYNEIFIF